MAAECVVERLQMRSRKRFETPLARSVKMCEGKRMATSSSFSLITIRRRIHGVLVCTVVQYSYLVRE